MAKPEPLPALFTADSATVAYYAKKDGKLTVSYQGCEARWCCWGSGSR